MTGCFYIGREAIRTRRSEEKDKLPEAGRAVESFRLEARGATFTAWIQRTRPVEYTNAKFADARPSACKSTRD